MKQNLKKGLAAVLCTALLFGLVPADNNLITVKADGVTPEVRDVNLGLGGIKNPTAPNSPALEWSNGTGSYVYFGNYQGESVKWNVLSTGTDKMFLLSNQILDKVQFNQNTNNGWVGSYIRSWLNGSSFLWNAFGSLDQAAIQSTTTNSAGSYSIGGCNFYDPFLSADKIFLLSSGESSNSTYGFYNGSGNPNNTTKASATNYAKSSRGLTDNYWWLRSADSANGQYAGQIDPTGQFVTWDVTDDQTGVRPALNLNPSSVLFTTASTVYQPVFGMVGTNSVSANTWKLTLKGTDSSFAAILPATGKTGQNITVKVTAVGSGSMPYNQTSAMLVDSKGTVVAYGGISNTVTTGDKTFTIPSSLVAGTYTLKVFQESFGNSSNYASKVVESSIVVSSPYNVAITNPSNSHITRTTTSGAALQTGLAGAMTDVVYTADDGYYFPDNYNNGHVLDNNGITVTRNNSNRITVSGIPITDATISLTAAIEKSAQEVPLGLTDGVNKIAGTTTAMEYASSDTASTWIPCSDGNTVVSPGTWYIRYRSTDIKKAGASASVVVTAPEPTPTPTPTPDSQPIVNVPKLAVSINLDRNTLYLTKGKSALLQATVTPSDTTNKAINWTSSNTNVATVDVSGNVTAIKNGTAVITATTTNGSAKSAQCNVTVGYAVTYKCNGGTNVDQNPGTVTGTSKVKLNNPTRSGFAFGGWYSDKKLTKGINSIAKGTKSSVTLYAKWDKVKVDKPSVWNLTNVKKKKMNVKFDKVDGAKGYEVVYSTDKKFAQNATTITAGKTSPTISKLEKGKKYYVKVRAYKLDSTGNKVYGKFSSTMSIKIN